MRTTFYLSALAALALNTSVAFAQESTVSAGLPQPRTLGNVTYVTGGIGEEETNAIEGARADYNLYVMSANTTGHFKGETNVVISDSHGDVVLDVASGPLLYVNLPNGRYTITGTTRDGQTKSQKLNITSGKTQNVHFTWK